MKKQTLLVLILGFMANYALSTETPSDVKEVLTEAQATNDEPKKHPVNTTGIAFKMKLNTAEKFRDSLPITSDNELENIVVIKHFASKDYIKKYGGTSYEPMCTLEDIAQTIANENFKKAKKPSRELDIKDTTDLVKFSQKGKNFIPCVYCQLTPKRIHPTLLGRKFGERKDPSGFVILDTKDTSRCEDVESYFEGFNGMILDPEYWNSSQ